MRNDDLKKLEDDCARGCEVPMFANKRLAYIKPISPCEARAMGVVFPPGLRFAPKTRLYALHAADGTTLGVTDTHISAYSAAVENDFVPLSVH